MKVVERKHQDLLNVARALMFRKYFNNIYLINRLPTPKLANKSPIELHSGEHLVTHTLNFLKHL